MCDESGLRAMLGGKLSGGVRKRARVQRLAFSDLLLDARVVADGFDDLRHGLALAGERALVGAERRGLELDDAHVGRHLHRDVTERTNQ